MPPEPNLCRGWTASNIREAVLAASDRQRDVLAQIAANPGTTSEEIAAELGLKSPRSVRATMAAWSRVTKPLGIRDPATGEPSWPMTFEKPAGYRYWRYYMPSEVAEVVLGITGRT